MGFIRSIKDRDYTAIKNTIFEDPKVSLKAKGLLGFMFTKPDYWDFSVNGLMAQLKEGRDSISAGLKELEKFGYLSRVEVRYKNGQFKDYDYWITDNPQTVLPKTENPTTDNQPQVSTILSKEGIEVITKKEVLLKSKMADVDISDVPEDLKKFFEISEAFRGLFKKNIESSGGTLKHVENAKFKAYVDPIRKLINDDGASVENLQKVFRYLDSPEGNFWKPNILSTKKLREKYNAIILKINPSNGTKQPKLGRQTVETFNTNREGWNVFRGATSESGTNV